MVHGGKRGCDGTFTRSPPRLGHRRFGVVVQEMRRSQTRQNAAGRGGNRSSYLNGRAELGPRALGNRSILAAATSSKMKDLLNDMKGRESYGWWLRFSWKAVCAQIRTCCSTTPCAPAGWRGSRQLFTSTAPPGSRQSTRDRTLSWNGVLVEYEKLSKIPVLCNTSANHKGRGFFSDVRSVAQWRRVDAIWCDRRLYRGEL